MFPADFISGSRDFTQHLTSGELIFIHSAGACILVYNVDYVRACSKKPFWASLNHQLKIIERFNWLWAEYFILTIVVFANSDNNNFIKFIIMPLVTCRFDAGVSLLQETYKVGKFL